MAPSTKFPIQFSLRSPRLRGEILSPIPTNIAEGAGRTSDADFARFIVVAAGSASETEYLVLLARDLGYIDPERYASLAESIENIKRMLSGLLRSLRKK